MLAATTMSGLPAPVPNTPSAASLFAAESLLCAGPGAPGLAAHPQPPLRAAGRDRHRHSLRLRTVEIAPPGISPSAVHLGRRDVAHSLDKMRTRGAGVKPVGEILRFVGHQSFAEFHDAHRVRWYAVIGQYEFSDPEIAAADNSPDGKMLLAWLDGSALLNIV